MYSEEIIKNAKQLKESGLNLSQISKSIGVNRSTIRDWLSDTKRYVSKKVINIEDDFFNRFQNSEEVRKAYYYILGQYFGDGYISPNSRTYRLRISATDKYKNIINEIKKSLKLILPNNSIYEVVSKGCITITINSNCLPKIFPHCGGGKKHERKIQLLEWQLKYLEENSKYLARGLFHSDGCLYNKANRRWYVFSNCSEDIHGIFHKCLELNSVYYNYTKNKPRLNQSDSWNTLIYRKTEIDKAFAFLGEKS